MKTNQLKTLLTSLLCLLLIPCLAGCSTLLFEDSADVSEQIVYQDDQFTVTYLDLKDTTGVTMATMTFRVENHSDKNVWLSLPEGYANDTSVTFLGGNALNGIAPDKSAVVAFTFGYNNILEDFDDLEKLEFKVAIIDSDSILTTLAESKTITLDFKKATEETSASE